MSPLSETIRVGASCHAKGVFTLAKGHDVDAPAQVVARNQKNMILDNGFAILLGNESNGPMSHFRVGASSAPVSAGQSALVSQIASTFNTQTDLVEYATSAPWWIRRTVTRRFSAGAAAGNIAEMGAGSAATGNTLFSRALVRDLSGEPTTVVVEPDEFLDMTYSLTVYLSAEDAVGTVTVNGTPHTVTVRPAYLGVTTDRSDGPMGASVLRRVGNYLSTRVSTAGLSPLNSAPAGTSVDTTSTIQPYIPGSHYGEVEVRFGVSVANLAGGIRSVYLRMSNFQNYQMSFDPPLPKTASQELKIRFRINMARSDAT